MASNEKTASVKANPALQKYYGSLESRIGYRLFLGDTRHFGYYPSANASPFPVGKALRAMEGKLYEALGSPQNSTLFDAGCGFGHVAQYMAKRGGNKVDCIDIIERHVAKAKEYVARAGLQESITVQLGDYHNLEKFSSSSVDGLYTIETFVHATEPLVALREFLRVLKPGGRIALFEYDHVDLDKAPKKQADAMRKVNKYAAMPANASFDYDVLPQLLEEAGFEDVKLEDLSEHIVPMMWLFYIFAIIPYLLLKLFGLENRFVNVMAGAEMYHGRDIWRFIAVTGRKKKI